MGKVIRVVVIGPESTGKSTLCQQLAEHFNTLWCPEYAREYLLTHGITYSYDDLLTIAKGQVALEEEYEARVKAERLTLKPGEAGNGEPADVKDNKLTTGVHALHPASKDRGLLFIDTDMYVMKVWSEYVFGKCELFILEEIARREYDLYLLCNPDLPWEPDVLREHPDEASRRELYRIYKNLMLHQGTPFVEITGNYSERLHTAIQAVNVLLGD